MGHGHGLSSEPWPWPWPWPLRRSAIDASRRRRDRESRRCARPSAWATRRPSRRDHRRAFGGYRDASAACLLAFGGYRDASGPPPQCLWRVPERLRTTAAAPLEGARTPHDDRRRRLWRVPGRLGRRAVAPLEGTGTPREARRGAFGQYRDAPGGAPTALGGPREFFGASFPVQPAPPLGFAGGVAATRSGTAAAAEQRQEDRGMPPAS